MWWGGVVVRGECRSGVCEGCVGVGVGGVGVCLSVCLSL